MQKPTATRPGSLLLLRDLLEEGAACMDLQLGGQICWPQEASSGEIKGNILAPALEHSYVARQAWPVEEHRARLGVAAEEPDASHRAAGDCR